MVHQTRGICLNFVRFKESAIIVQMFTEAFGRQSYIVHGARSARSKSNKIALYQPLTQLELVVWHKPHREVQRISEARLHYGYRTLPTHPRKAIVAMFLAEILTKTLKTEEEDEALFSFLLEALQTFDAQAQHFENFHLQFLLKLPNYFGLGLRQADALVENLAGVQYSSAETLRHTQRLIDVPLTETVKITLAERREILQRIVQFYQYHFENFVELNSWDVLRAVQ